MTGPRDRVALVLGTAVGIGPPDTLERSLGSGWVVVRRSRIQAWQALVAPPGRLRLIIVTLGSRSDRAALWAAATLARRRPVPLLVVGSTAGDLARARADRTTRLVTARMITRSVHPGPDGALTLEPALTAMGVGPAPTEVDGVNPLGIDDLPEVVGVHMAAFPGSAMTQLGPTVVDRYYRWQFTGDHPLPHAAGFRANGELVGFLFGGVRRDAISGFARRFLFTIALHTLTHPRALRDLVGPNLTQVGRLALRRRPRETSGAADPPSAAPLSPLNPTGPTGAGSEAGTTSFGVLSIAVAPHAQGSPAATELMAHAERAARSASIERMHLTVDPANTRAIRFYTRSGWEPTVESGREWTGRMHKDLEPAAARYS